MKSQLKWTRVTVLLTAALFAARAYALDIDLGNAAPYSAFVFEDASGLTSSAGRIAVGGNLSLTTASIGAGTPTLASVPSLVVRGNITSYTGGGLWSGSSTGFGQYVGTKAASTPASLDLRKVASLPVDFDSERVYLTAMSEQLRDLPNTGQASVSGSTLTLTGSNNSTLEVFSLSAAQVAATQTVALANVAPDVHIVINLSADSLRRVSFGINTLALAGWQGRVLFNAYDAETLQFNGLTLWGSLLATNACICTSTGQLQGSVVARKWTATMSITYTPFVPKP